MSNKEALLHLADRMNGYAKTLDCSVIVVSQTDESIGIEVHNFFSEEPTKGKIIVGPHEGTVTVEIDEQTCIITAIPNKVFSLFYI